jgi:hypothetical protein
MDKKCYVVVDVEANGSIPHVNEMTSFGAVVVEPGFTKRFYSRLFTVGGPSYNETVDETVEPETALNSMTRFNAWLKENSNDKTLVFVSDNPCFDWQFINYYFHTTIGQNPFGFSGRRIGDFWAGLHRDWENHNRWRDLVETPHTHNPLDDAIGHAEALLKMLRVSSSPVVEPSTAVAAVQPPPQTTQPSSQSRRTMYVDWKCKVCDVVIFGSKDNCKKCGTPNPKITCKK